MRRPLNQLRLAVLCLVLVAGVAVFPGVAAAQSGVGGSFVVESDETVSSINGVAGSIVVEGTVTGDVSGLAGNVVIEEGGTVEGDISVATGTLRISGEVGGDVSAGAGALHITESGVVGGDLDVGAGNVDIDGTVGGDARVGAETIVLGETATIEGSLTYDGDLQGNTDAVAGDITRDQSLGFSLADDIQPFVSWVFAVNVFVLNFLLGLLLVGLFPGFSDRVAQQVGTAPVRSGLAGLGVLVGIPIAFTAVALTIVGIPLVLVGILAFALLAWVGLVYGRFAVGSWLLSYTDWDNRVVALLVGLLLAVILHQIPLVGGLANFLIFLLGFGAVVIGLVTRRRRLGRAESKRPATDEQPAEGPAS
jgi:cytoskeletal protein CcmA (bactofilin family)